MFNVQTATNTFLSNLSVLENRLTRDNNEVSSGLKVQTIADAPQLDPEILDLNAEIAQNGQIGNNLAQAGTEVAAAEGSVNSATNIMDEATQIATEGSNGTTTNNTQLANQVSDLLTQMQQLSMTQVAGRFVFSGDKDQTAPYGAVNLTANPTNGVGAYQGNNGVRYIEDPNGVNFAISFTAQQIFDGGTGGGSTANSVFQSLTELYNALKSGTQTSVMQAADDVRSASTYLSGILAQYGDIQKKISDAQTTQSTMNTNFLAQLSNLQDVDEAQAVTQQQTDSTALQAAETAYASLPKKSLFDYLA